MNERDQVLKAAADLVSAFARNDREAYFGAFSTDASFVFYTLDQPLLSRDAYQALWDSWRAEDGFEVLSCTSSNAFVACRVTWRFLSMTWPPSCACKGSNTSARSARRLFSENRRLAKNNKACGWPVTNICPPCRKGCQPLSQTGDAHAR